MKHDETEMRRSTRRQRSTSSSMTTAKFKPGDKVIISKDSKNVWIQEKKATIIRFLEEDNVPGSFYQWTYEVKLEDGDKCYVPQWEMKLESGPKRNQKHLIFKDKYESRRDYKRMPCRHPTL